MTETVTIEHAKRHISTLLDRVANDADEILISNGDRPVAKLVPVSQTINGPRIPGSDAGKIWMADDFNDPLPDDALGG